MFLNAMLAGFVVLGAVPIIIHLLNKQRYRVVDWAAIQFLLKTLQKNSRRLQMRDLILLALRTAAVILVALALARPTIAAGRFALLGGGGAINAVIVLDNSRSMGYREGAETRFAVAKGKAKGVVDQLPKGSGAALVLMSDIGAAEVSEPSHDLAFVAEAVDKAPLSDGGTSIAAGLGKAWEILKRAEGAREIYLVTDLQANGWPAAEDAGWRALTSEIAAMRDVRVFLADVGGGAVENVSLDALEPGDPLVTTDGDSAFVVRVRNHGATAADNVEVQLLVDDGRGGDLRAAASAAIERLEGTQEVVLQTRFEHGGRHRIEARVGADHLEGDNARHLAVDVIDRLRVLVVDGSAEGGFAGGAGFIRAALSPGLAAPDESAAGALIETELTSPNALSDAALDSYQAVVLSDVAELPPTVADGLKAYVAGGKALIAFLGANVRPAAWNAALGERAGILPARIGAQPIDFPGEGAARGVGFATAQLTHPIVAFFADKEAQPFMAQPRFYHAFPLEVPEGAADAVVVARFAGGEPALVERPVGAGTVLLFAGSADREWSDFPLRPAFLMIVRRTVQHAVLSRRAQATARVHDALLAQLPARDAGQRLPVRDPRGGSSQVSASLATDGRTAVAEVAETPFAGFWQVGDGEAAQRFALNAPRDESVLDGIDREAIATRSTIEWQWVGADGDVGAQIARSRVGREIWAVLMTLAIACLLAESYLAMRWAPKGA